MNVSMKISVADITGGKYRKSVICLFETFWGVGIVLLPIVAIGMPYWSWTSIYLGISLPTIVYIFAWFLIPDSPKWLLAHNKLGAAKVQLLDAMRVNNKSEELPSNVDSFLQLEAAAVAKLPKPDTWPSLWSSKKQIVLMIALHTAWAVDVTNYNGMLLNIRVFGRDYLIINTIVCGVCEIVGVFCAYFIVMNATNRKFLCSGLFNIIAGAASCLGLIFPKSCKYIKRFALFFHKMLTDSLQCWLYSTVVVFLSFMHLFDQLSFRNRIRNTWHDTGNAFKNSNNMLASSFVYVHNRTGANGKTENMHVFVYCVGSHLATNRSVRWCIHLCAQSIPIGCIRNHWTLRRHLFLSRPSHSCAQHHSTRFRQKFKWCTAWRW